MNFIYFYFYLLISYLQVMAVPNVYDWQNISDKIWMVGGNTIETAHCWPRSRRMDKDDLTLVSEPGCHMYQQSEMKEHLLWITIFSVMPGTAVLSGVGGGRVVVVLQVWLPWQPHSWGLFLPPQDFHLCLPISIFVENKNLWLNFLTSNFSSQKLLILKF